MPHGVGSNVKVRLYLEGVLLENGFDGCMVSGNVGAPATAQIQLVPTNTAKHIMPFTWVHVFVTDPLDSEAKGDLSDYKLLFEGVVIARGFARQDDGRSLVLQCAAPEIFWVEARQYWLNVTSTGGGIVDQMVTATSGGYGTFGTVTKTGTFGYMIDKIKLSQYQDKAEEKFLDTLIAVLDDVGNVNPFYVNARNRFRITDRVLRGPAGNTEKLFQLALFSDFLDGLAGRQSGNTTWPRW